MKINVLLLSIVCLAANSVFGQTLYVPGGTGGIGSSSSSNVGIGTAAPSNIQGWDKVLDVQGLTNSKVIATTSGSVYRAGIYSHNTWNGGGGFIGTESNHKLHFITNYTSKMTLDTDGNLGIATTTPSALLHINSGVDARKTFRIYWNTDLSKYLNIWQGTGAAILDPIGTGLLYLGYDQSTNVIVGNNGGSLGIGTTTPNARLDVNGTTGDSNTGVIIVRGTGANALLKIGINADYSWIQSHGSRPLSINELGNNTFLNSTGGYVGIGTTSPDAKLTVNGIIHTKEVKIDLSVPGPDYVFEKDYKLPSLEQIKSYIDQNKHLPEVPSAKEMEANGVNVGEMNMLLLKKVEELTLYLIDLKKSQQTEIDLLKKEIENLKERK